MSKQPIYKVSDRVSFMAWTTEVVNGTAIDTLRSFVGYVKQVRRGLFKTSYAINVAKSDEIFVVNEADVFGIVEKKENKFNKTNKTEENGD